MESSTQSEDIAASSEIIYGQQKQRTNRNQANQLRNSSEKDRREKIKEKTKELQEMIPNSHELDNISLLDGTISYINTLQQQIQAINGVNSFSNVLLPPFDHSQPVAPNFVSMPEPPNPYFQFPVSSNYMGSQFPEMVVHGRYVYNSDSSSCDERYGN